MRSTSVISIGCIVFSVFATGITACGDDDSAAPGPGGSSGNGSSGNGSSGNGSSGTGSSGTSGGGTSSGTVTPPEKVQSGPAAGNPDGHSDVPTAGQAEDVSNPTKVIGSGTADSCKAADFVAAVAAGGVITFNCGADPVTITLTETARILNTKGPKIVIDGGNKVTLSGGGKIRILHMATCDKTQGGYPPGPGDCNTAAAVQLVVQNLTFVDGNAKNIPDDDNNSGGGGAIYAQGGSLKVVHSRFFNNVCADLGSDLGGGAIRKLDYLIAPGAGPARPVWVVNSTFGGEDGLGNVCANGGALSSIGVSWNIINSSFGFNSAIGMGANKPGMGGNGGAIYNDGEEIVMDIKGSYFHDNKANEGGSAVFFVSNHGAGTITITDSKTERNPRGNFETSFGFYVKTSSEMKVVNSQILR